MHQPASVACPKCQRANKQGEGHHSREAASAVVRLRLLFRHRAVTFLGAAGPFGLLLVVPLLAGGGGQPVRIRLGQVQRGQWLVDCEHRRPVMGSSGRLR